MSEIKAGDKVIITSGRFKGKSGYVSSAQGDYANVQYGNTTYHRTRLKVRNLKRG